MLSASPTQKRHLHYIIKQKLWQWSLLFRFAFLSFFYRLFWSICSNGDEIGFLLTSWLSASSGYGDYFKWNTIFHWLSLNRRIVRYDTIRVSHLRIVAIPTIRWSSDTKSRFIRLVPYRTIRIMNRTILKVTVHIAGH
jgi:hypothetical protein